MTNDIFSQCSSKIHCFPWTCRCKTHLLLNCFHSLMVWILCIYYDKLEYCTLTTYLDVCSTRAMLYVANMQEAERAVLECNQMTYKGRRLLVNISKHIGNQTVNFLSSYHSMDKIKCTVTSDGKYPDWERTITVEQPIEII